MSNRGKWKGKKGADTGRPKGPDYSPLVGSVDLSNRDVEIYLVKMPVYLTDQFEDPSRGVVGRLRMPASGPPSASSPSAAAAAPSPSPSPSPSSSSSPATGTASSGGAPTAKAEPKPAGDSSGIVKAELFIDKPLQTASGTRRISSQIPGGLTALGGGAKGRSSSSSSPGKGGGLLSTEYTMTFVGADPGIYVFSSLAHGAAADGARVEGRVSQRCVAQPKLDSAYKALSKARTRLSNTSTRGMARLDEGERKRHERASLRPTDLGETAREREERKKRKESARSHLDMDDSKWREAMRIDVFKAYERQSHYTAEELARAIGEERTIRVRPTIAEVCTYNKAGPFAGKYELKDEFKTEAQRRQREHEVEAHRLTMAENARKRKEERLERERQDKEAPQAKRQRKD